MNNGPSTPTRREIELEEQLRRATLDRRQALGELEASRAETDAVLEALMVAIPRMQKYEDDLRDQWQRRAHRDEWRRMLRLVCEMATADGHDVVSLSGEIHLATRAIMQIGEDRVLHQLVASGIAHRPPPRAFARALGALSWLGEDPLPRHPIRIARLPGQPTRYVAERNYLILERAAETWTARWDLEVSGMTPPLPL